MITKLTKEQTAKIPEYQWRYFNQAVSTEPADRARAEKAARRLAEIAGSEIASIEWSNDPYQWDSFKSLLQDPLRSLLKPSPECTLHNMLSASLSASLWGPLWGPLWGSLKSPLMDTFSDSPWGSPGSRLRNMLWGTLWNSLGDTDRVCLNTFAVKELGIEIGEKQLEILHQYNEIAASCFAVWVISGAALFCERPETVEIADGKLVGLTWREEEEGCTDLTASDRCIVGGRVLLNALRRFGTKKSTRVRKQGE